MKLGISSSTLGGAGKCKGVPDHIVQILVCQVKTLGVGSENDEESWIGFYREVEGQGQYVRMSTLIKICTIS